MGILEQVQEDVKTAMKAGDRDRVGQLRMLVHALQAEEKEGRGDEVAALQRESAGHGACHPEVVATSASLTCATSAAW